MATSKPHGRQVGRFELTHKWNETKNVASGEFPESLDALIPTFLPDPLLDPINAEPFFYQRYAPDQFKLWSVGGNRVNEQGEPADRPNQLTTGDWVWQTVQREPPAKTE